MRATANRQKLVTAAVLAASVALTAACGQKPGTGTAPSPSPGSTEATVPAGTLLIADGTSTVLLGQTKITFPVKVSEPAVSADGSRIAFIDGDGNVCTARLDGTDLIVLTSTDAKVKRSRPTWKGRELVYAETASDGKTALQISDGITPKQSWSWGGAGNSAPEAGEGHLAYEHRAGKESEVWIVDELGRDSAPMLVGKGTQPAVSQDERVAYVAADGQVVVKNIKQLNGKARQITFGVAHPSHLSWSPDGRTLAFQSDAGLGSVPTEIPEGATDNAVTKLAEAPATADYLPGARGLVARVSGADSVALSVALSQALWPPLPGSLPEGGTDGREVILFSDPQLALTTQVSARGPVLFNPKDALDPRITAELQRVVGVGGRNRSRIHLLGAFSPDVAKALQATGHEVVREDSAPITLAGALSSDPDAGLVVAAADDPVNAALALGVPHPYYLLPDPLPASFRDQLVAAAAQRNVTVLGAKARAALASTPGRFTFVEQDPAEYQAAQAVAYDRLAMVVRSSDLTALALARQASRYGIALFVLDGEPGPALKAWLSHASIALDQVIIVDGPAKVPSTVDDLAGRLISGPVGFDKATNPTAN